MENYPEGCEFPVLKIGQYPLPKKQLMQLVEACNEILVLEDGQPFVEKQLKGCLGIGVKVKGRLDGTLSQDGELNPDSVARAVGKENKAEFPHSLKCAHQPCAKVADTAICTPC